MSKQIIIDPEWEERERQRVEYTPPSRPRRGEPEELDPFGVELPPDVEPPFDPDDSLPAQESGTAYDDSGHISLYDEPGHGYRPGDDYASGPDDASEGGDASGYAPGQPAAQEDPFTRRDEDIPASKAKEWIGMLLSGSILTRGSVRRSYPYLLMIAFLMLLYISSLFRMQQLHRREIELTRQVKELRATSLELSARRMNSTRRSSILDELDRRGIPLQESIEAPKIVDR